MYSWNKGKRKIQILMHLYVFKLPAGEHERSYVQIWYETNDHHRVLYCTWTWTTMLCYNHAHIFKPKPSAI